ncbi:hypothetical protein D3P07_04065 [Paenibacillus sp. 1011MAR3C5]|nr:hypothetical protein D3P07_04065 [Paenibacillus sp. 1011MAR3C5]
METEVVSELFFTANSFYNISRVTDLQIRFGDKTWPHAYEVDLLCKPVGRLSSRGFDRGFLILGNLCQMKGVIT